jgi:hypothetical protein
MVICTEREVINVKFSDTKVEDIFLRIFIHSHNNTSKPVTILSCEQFFSANIASGINDFKLLYQRLDKTMERLFSVFSKLKIGEYFFIFPRNIKMTNELVDYSKIYLKNRNCGFNENEAIEEVEKIHKVYENLYAGIKERYEIEVFSPEKMMKIGEKIKAKRICRFCNRKQGELDDSGNKTTFKSIAHAIPEALGNKLIIGTEECDSCNNIFASNIELDLINFCNIYRVFWGVEGKHKVPKIKYKNGVIANAKNNFIVEQSIDSFITDKDGQLQQIKLASKEKINFMGIYRCLAKIALSVIDRKYIEHFSRTIRWIKGENLGVIPVVGLSIQTHVNPHRHPHIILYRRKDNNLNVPYMVAEFSFCNVFFVYIMPFCDQDSKSFVEKTDFDNLWNIFQQYNQKNISWTFMDFSEDKKQDYILNLNINNRKPLDN